MTELDPSTKPQRFSHVNWPWLVPLLALSPLAFTGSGCNNSGVIGDDCPTTAECAIAGGGGSGSSAGSSAGGRAASGPGKRCGGLLGTSCGEGLFCDFYTGSCGASDQLGTCTATPSGCTAIYSPVCGCDGKEYGNACAANLAGVSVAAEGECESSSGGSASTGGSSASGGGGGASHGATCGGLRGAQCAEHQYCSFPPGSNCGAADQTGTCEAKPDACDLVYAPVCGCDGMTYDNDCAAASAGVSVAKTGECAAGGNTCGGRGGGVCATNEYCKYTPEALCGRADATGTCTRILEGGCTANFDPVCGCDGMTYGNDCEAGRAGVSIDHTGACATTGETCGGLIGATCKSGFFCNFPPAWACGNGDGTGTCTAIPDACDAVLKPVCGCDAKPYSNECEANAHGTSVANQGACN